MKEAQIFNLGKTNESDFLITVKNPIRQLLLSLTLCIGILLTAGYVKASIGPVPANIIRLDDYGGVPGAASSSIISAFNQAFSRLKSLGGGTLLVPPGTYNLGSYSTDQRIINVSDLSNVVISAYGAKLTVTTTVERTNPIMLGFQNPSNVTVAGLSFYDFGGDPNQRRGAICISVDTSKPVSGFKTVDILADKVGVMFRAAYPSVNYSGSEFDIHGTVKNTYYGVSSSYNGRFSKANITAINTRRAFIAYGARDWNVTVNGSADGVAPGSNAFIHMAPSDIAPVENVTVNLTASGNLRNYTGLVHIYNQGPLNSYSYARNVKAHVILNNVSISPRRVFVLDHEYPSGTVNASSPRTYQQIQFSGQVIGSFTGRMIDHPTVSTGSPNSILVSSTLASYQDINLLPSYFDVGSVTNPVPLPQPEPQPLPQPQPAPVAVTLSSLQASSDVTNANYKYNFTGAINYHRLFLDTDNNASTGFRKGEIGSNFLIENGVLFRYTGLNGAWGWTKVKTVQVSSTSSSMSITVARADLGSPPSLKLIAEIAASTGGATSEVISQTMALPAVSLFSVQATNDSSRVYYKYSFMGQIQFHRLFLDTDGNASSGYQRDGIGANYMIENGRLYRYAGSSGRWGWTFVKAVSVTATSTSMSISAARTDLRSPRAIKLIFEIAGATGAAASGVLTQTLR